MSPDEMREFFTEVCKQTVLESLDGQAAEDTEFQVSLPAAIAIAADVAGTLHNWLIAHEVFPPQALPPAEVDK